MGCNQGKPPTVIANQVLAVNRYHGPANLVVGGRPIDGRSGGGLFDQEGVLVGVCCAADQEADEGLYSALGPIHAELDRSGLGFIYRKPGSKASGNQPLIAAVSAVEPIGNAISQPTEPQLLPPAPNALSAINPPPAVAGSSDPIAATVPTEGLPTSSTTELICILRNRNQQGAAGQAYVIDRPSEQLRRALSQELQQRGPLTPTNAFEGPWRSQPAVGDSRR